MKKAHFILGLLVLSLPYYHQAQTGLINDLSEHPASSRSVENKEALKQYFLHAQSFTNKDSLFILNPFFYEVDWDSAMITDFFGDSSYVFPLKDELFSYAHSFKMQIVMPINITNRASIRSLFYICDSTFCSPENHEPEMLNFTGHVIESDANDELINLYTVYQGDIMDIASIQSFDVPEFARERYGIWSKGTLKHSIFNWFGNLLGENLSPSVPEDVPSNCTGSWNNGSSLPWFKSGTSDMPCQKMVEAFIKEYNQRVEVFDLAYLIGDFEGNCSSKESLDEFIRGNLYYNWYLENIDGGPDYKQEGADWNKHSPFPNQHPTRKD